MNPNNPNSSAPDQAGSGKGPAGNGAGQPGNVNYEALYNELEQKLGSQGKELGEYRTFFEGIAPILDVLDKSPEMVQAITDGKLDNSLAKAALEGKLTVSDVKTVEKAYAEVQKDLGKKGYEKATAEDITKLVEERVGEVKKEMDNSLRESEELRAFEGKVNDFVERTPDFANYARDIEGWLDDHEDITDIEVAYYAVKGQLSGNEASQKAEEEKAEYAKNMALNAGGGGYKSNFIDASEGDVIDSLIAPKSNPNAF